MPIASTVGGVVGTIANRPNRGEFIGARYFATDEHLEYVWNGAAWHLCDYGGGHILNEAQVGDNFITTSTSFVDIPGMAFTQEIPDGPMKLSFLAHILIETSGERADLRVVADGSPIGLIDMERGGATNDERNLSADVTIPAPGYAPAPGSLVTFKGQLKTSVGTSDAAVWVTFGGPVGVCWLRAETG